MNPARMNSTTHPKRARRGVAAAICSVALLAACGSDKGRSGAADTTPATATTSTAAPLPTAAPSTGATVTVATVATVVSSTGSPTTEQATAAGADTTEAPATSNSTVDSAPATGDEFKEVAPPTVPTTSAEIVAAGTQPDGVYYATVTNNGDPLPADGAVVLEFVQLFRGHDCTAHFGTANTDSCVNDYGVVNDPTAAVEVPLDSQYITVSDAATQKSYRVSGNELYGLLHGEDPAASAPDGYTYTGFGYIVTVSGGKVTRMEQWWTP